MFVELNKNELYNHISQKQNYKCLENKEIEIFVDILSNWLINLVKFNKKYKGYRFELLEIIGKIENLKIC